jgi:chaperonin cofactor prefoldin
MQQQKLMSQAVQSQKQLSIVKTQIQSKEKERKILTLTQRELSAVPERTRGEETRMYKGVGKMYVIRFLSYCRNSGVGICCGGPRKRQHIALWL